MNKVKLLFFLFFLFCVTEKSFPQVVGSKIYITSEKLLDVKTGMIVKDPVIVVEGDTILQLGSKSSINVNVAGLSVIDLGKKTIIPGLIDAHSHIVSNLENPTFYQLNLISKSTAYRVLEGAYNANLTLMAGFTTVRDLGSEGAGYADVSLRDAINQNLVPGPRMLVATRAISSVGGYLPFNVSTEYVNIIQGIQTISGVEEARRAVREQIRGGADVIKIYADFSDSIENFLELKFRPTLTIEEMKVIVEEAHQGRKKVAAHAMTPKAVRNAIEAGVDSIEHGWLIDKETILLAKEREIFLVPTLGQIYFSFEESKDEAERRVIGNILQNIQKSFTLEVSLHLKIAAGYDASGSFAHGKNSKELLAMWKMGMPSMKVIQAATVHAAELLGLENKLGSLEVGKYADIVAVEGDLLNDLSGLEKIPFVMKGGRIFKNEK